MSHIWEVRAQSDLQPQEGDMQKCRTCDRLRQSSLSAHPVMTVLLLICVFFVPFLVKCCLTVCYPHCVLYCVSIAGRWGKLPNNSQPWSHSLSLKSSFTMFFPLLPLLTASHFNKGKPKQHLVELKVQCVEFKSIYWQNIILINLFLLVHEPLC